MHDDKPSFPDNLIDNQPAEGQSDDEAKARSLIEKKSAINLIEAFSVSIKHYLRGEDGIYYRYVF